MDKFLKNTLSVYSYTPNGVPNGTGVLSKLEPLTLYDIDSNKKLELDREVKVLKWEKSGTSSNNKPFYNDEDIKGLRVNVKQNIKSFFEDIVDIAMKCSIEYNETLDDKWILYYDEAESIETRKNLHDLLKECLSYIYTITNEDNNEDKLVKDQQYTVSISNAMKFLLEGRFSKQGQKTIEIPEEYLKDSQKYKVKRHEDMHEYIKLISKANGDNGDNGYNGDNGDNSEVETEKETEKETETETEMDKDSVLIDGSQDVKVSKDLSPPTKGDEVEVKNEDDGVEPITKEEIDFRLAIFTSELIKYFIKLYGGKFAARVIATSTGITPVGCANRYSLFRFFEAICGFDTKGKPLVLSSSDDGDGGKPEAEGDEPSSKDDDTKNLDEYRLTLSQIEEDNQIYIFKDRIIDHVYLGLNRVDDSDLSTNAGYDSLVKT